MTKTEACVKEYFEKGILGNIAIRVGKTQQVLFELYQPDSGTVDKDTLFDMASVTKIVVTASLALIVLDRGLISLEDRVAEYFDCPKDKSSLTVEHLLTHRMGIGHKDLRQPGFTYDNIQDYILSIPGDIPIGENVLYSCPGFILLGKILEKVYGERLDSAFQRLVTILLGLHDTAFLPDKNHIFVNSNKTADECGMVNDYNCRALGGVCGNAGVFSNMTDMTAYVQMLLRHGAPLFGREIFDKAVQNHTPNMDSARGLGFLYVDENYSQTGDLFPAGSIGHCGHIGQSVFVDLKSGLYVIILSDATIATVKKYGCQHYEEVMRMRQDIHNAIKADGY